MKQSVGKGGRIAGQLETRWQTMAVAGSFVTLLVARAAPNAAALSCVTDPETREPRDGATDVPLNTLIWGGLAGSRVLLHGPDGVVPSEQRHIPMLGYARRNSGLPVLIPLEPLLPDTTYTVEHGSGGERFRQFTTGSALDELAPAPPALVNSELIPGRLTLDFSVEGLLAGELDLASAPFTSLEDVLLPRNFGDGYRALADDKPAFNWLTGVATLRLNAGGVCSNWSASGYAIPARFGAFDLAGNFSGWSDAIVIEVPPAPEPPPAVQDDDVPVGRPVYGDRDGAACSVGLPTRQPPSPKAALPALLVALALLRRAARYSAVTRPTR